MPEKHLVRGYLTYERTPDGTFERHYAKLENGRIFEDAHLYGLGIDAFAPTGRWIEISALPSAAAFIGNYDRADLISHATEDNA